MLEYFLLGGLTVASRKGGITHQPISSSDPVNKLDHEVDVGDSVEILGHQVQPVVDAPQAMNVGTNPPARATFFVGHFHHFIGHSTVLANHVFGPVSCN